MMQYLYIMYILLSFFSVVCSNMRTLNIYFDMLSTMQRSNVFKVNCKYYINFYIAIAKNVNKILKDGLKLYGKSPRKLVF